ncbi:MAG TPA: glycosyltransferase [Gemmataceae bacterium]|nr:glycosyltransferase [Gemmataceae bacterium]
MHILFLHRQFPAQFGQIARHLVQHGGVQCTFVCERPSPSSPGAGPVQFFPDFAAGTQIGMVAPQTTAPQVFQFNTIFPTPSVEPPPDDEIVEGIHRIQYQLGDREAAGFDGLIAHANAFYQTLKAHPEVQPDLVVGPSMYASSLFLPDLYACPVINYFDYYFQPSDSYVTFRPDFPPTDLEIVRARAHNALVLQDLRSCRAGYSPTSWQRNLFPAEYHPKLATIFDGIDRAFWYRRPAERYVAGRAIPNATRVVTYVARGLEAMRGFDIFMKVAKGISKARRDVVFVVVGSEHFYHGSDLNHIQAPSFLQHVLQQDAYDLERFIFTGRIPSTHLVEILSLSDLHIYLSAPFVLSWSVFNALACGCTVLASDTSPVREVIQHGQNGLLANFFDVEGLTRLAIDALDDPQKFQPLAEAGVRLIDEEYSLERVIPQMASFYEQVSGVRSSRFS